MGASLQLLGRTEMLDATWQGADSAVEQMYVCTYSVQSSTPPGRHRAIFLAKTQSRSSPIPLPCRSGAVGERRGLRHVLLLQHVSSRSADR